MLGARNRKCSPRLRQRRKFTISHTTSTASSFTSSQKAVKTRHSLLPIRRKDVELVALLRIFIRCEHQLLPIRRDFWKRREAAEIRYLLQSRAIQVHHVQLKLAAIAIVFIRRKQNLAAVRREGGSKAGAAEIGDLLGVLAVAVRYKQLH